MGKDEGHYSDVHPVQHFIAPVHKIKRRKFVLFAHVHDFMNMATPYMYIMSILVLDKEKDNLVICGICLFDNLHVYNLEHLSINTRAQDCLSALSADRA